MCGGEADRGAHVAVCDAWRRQDKSAGLLRPCTPYAVCVSTHAVCVWDVYKCTQPVRARC